MRTADGYIVNRCLNGDSAAFGLLVDRYKEGVYSLAYSKLRNFHDAEDVTQEVFIKAYQKLRTLRRYDEFHAWIYAITHNLCKDWLRARSRRPDREFIADQSPKALTDSSIDSYRESPLSEMLHEALDSLPETYQQVLTLCYLGGMNSREIAEFLGMSPANVGQRLSRARSQLKEGMLAMMSESFEQQRLQAGFTIRIVEAVKRIKIHPTPRMAGLPWGLSLAAGIILTVLSLSPHLSILNPMSTLTGSPLPAETKVLKTGEIAVDILKFSQTPIISGKQGDGDGGDIELANPQSALLLAPCGEGDTWAKKADMPTPRSWLSTSVVNGRIYAIGGDVWMQGNKWRCLSTVEEYDPATDKWTKKADMPTARSALATSTVDGRIYAVGGSDGVIPHLSTVEEYDPVTDTWTKKSDMPTPRYHLSTGAVNRRIYAIGGVREDIGRLSVLEEYDVATDTWVRKADMPTARYGFGASAVGAKIYTIGGKRDLPTVEEYTPPGWPFSMSPQGKLPTRWGELRRQVISPISSRDNSIAEL